MKYTYLMIMIVSMLICSCGPTLEEKTVTEVSGKITNPKSEVIKFSFDENSKEVAIDSTGSFSTSLEVEDATTVGFNHGGEYGTMYVRPGDKIFFSLETTEFDETLRFEGDAAGINNYKASLMLMEDSLIGFKELMLLEEDEFLAKIDSIERVKRQAMARFDVNDDAFIKDFVAGLKFASATNKLMYPGYHKNFTKLDSFEVSEDFYSFKDELDINDTSYLENSSFMRYIQTLVGGETSKRYSALPEEEKTPENYYQNQFEVSKELIDSEPVERDFLYTNIYRGFTYLPEDLRTEIITHWKTLNPKPEQLAKLNEKAKKWETISPGQPAPDFRYASIEGDTLQMDDFKGKLVYIDVWATWCGPCLAEQPAYEQLVERFEDEDVAFLAVSIDSSPAPWKKMVEKRQLKGIHLFAPGDWSSNIIKDYMIAGIPRYILIDKEGKIINANASRPSGDIGEKIAELLKKST